jgi:hypothetical protein
MLRPVSAAIVPMLLAVASVSLTTCSTPPPGFGVRWLDPAESAQTGFGRPSRAGFPDLLPDDRPEISAATGGKPVDAHFLDVVRVTVHPETLKRELAPAGQGALKVGLAYWNPRGLKETWEDGTVRVQWTLYAGDSSRELTTNGPMIASGESYLDTPGSTFKVTYPLPETDKPTSWGILQGTVRLPNSRTFDFREKVVRRSPWVP